MGKKSRSKSRTNAEIVEEITAGFIADLEQGVAPWVKPWDASAPLELPKNLKTGKAYRGSNVMFLWAAQEKLGYERALPKARFKPLGLFFRDLPEPLLAWLKRRAGRATQLAHWAYVGRKTEWENP